MVELELVLDDREEFFKGLLGSFCTRTKRDIVTACESSILTRREPETKISL
jgi:hypothetical protein